MAAIGRKFMPTMESPTARASVIHWKSLEKYGRIFSFLASFRCETATREAREF